MRIIKYEILKNENIGLIKYSSNRIINILNSK